MIVKLLNIEQKELLFNQKLDEDTFFNPVQDVNNNWIISFEEVWNCIYPEFNWLYQLPEIEFEPKIEEL